MIQDYLYQFSETQWILDRNDKITEIIFYSGIKKLFYVFVISIAVALILFRKYEFIQQYKTGLLIVLISTLLVPLVIGSLKSVTNIPCPKDIAHYGGSYPHVTVLKRYPDIMQQKARVKCFPAAHASGGFSLMALFFLFKKRRNRLIGLVSGLSIGWMTGIYKMLIGDHFLSHTIVSMIMAWLIILIVRTLIMAYSSRQLARVQR